MIRNVIFIHKYYHNSSFNGFKNDILCLLIIDYYEMRLIMVAIFRLKRNSRFKLQKRLWRKSTSYFLNLTVVFIYVQSYFCYTRPYYSPATKNLIMQQSHQTLFSPDFYYRLTSWFHCFSIVTEEYQTKKQNKPIVYFAA